MNEPQWERLAEAVKNRRLKLGLSARSAAMAAGINRATWGSMEDNTRRISEHLWSGVERALSWAPGSVQTVLAGGEPLVIQREPGTRRLPADFDLLDEYERIRGLTAIPCETKLDLIGQIIAMYEQDRVEQPPNKETRPA